MESDRKVPLPPGLPPLPKSLTVAPPSGSGSSSAQSITTTLINYGNLTETDLLGPSTSGIVNRHTKNHHRPGSLSSTLESLSDRESIYSAAASTNSQNSQTTANDSIDATYTLDTQIAMLRREMYGLRQLDLSLLSQLWALNESIQGFRIFLQEREVLSPPSPSPTASDTNSIASEGEDESLVSAHMPAPSSITISVPGGSSTSHASSCSTSGTSGLSSATSSVGKQQQAASSNPKSVQKSHPQLPLILQQRMRRAAPPAPPARTKPGGVGAHHNVQIKERPG